MVTFVMLDPRSKNITHSCSLCSRSVIQQKKYITPGCPKYNLYSRQNNNACL